MSENDDGESAELDEMRIHRIAAVRRAACRSRSHAVIAAVACAVAAAQSVVLLVRHLVSLGWGWWPMIYVAVAIFAAWGIIFFGRRAMALHREVTRPSVDQPTTPPDFSTLSDGSQRWKNLEDLK